jgi:F0F1-type ATP synthase assembly protein I
MFKSPAGVGLAMTKPPEDGRPPLAIAMELASQVISVALTMALPAGAGYWGDVEFGTSPWLACAGALFGLGAGMVQLLRGVGRATATTEKKIRGPEQKQR